MTSLLNNNYASPTEFHCELIVCISNPRTKDLKLAMIITQIIWDEKRQRKFWWKMLMMIVNVLTGSYHWLCFSDWLPHLGCFFPQRFGPLILRPSSGLSRTRELWNFEPNPLLFRGYHVLIPLRPLLLLLLNAVAAAAASIDAVTAIVFVTATALRIELSTLGDFQFLIQRPCVSWTKMYQFLGLLNLSSYSRFSLTIRGSQIVFSSIFGLLRRLLCPSMWAVSLSFLTFSSGAHCLLF